ncbi:type II toxin-antitoxin system VapC family toxin [Thermophagus xiamenensis]|jgi:hypothetical protein|uniref:PIN domain-containing protein n=1 Tax=Thermophagus xiamenensis TaxID=385682 RepID=A0A1I2ER14_9BACT|nr:type II toxin-antitoxin system VapC family toxin [Thermophagus xiamenensis]SFE95143.1 hypothetical protein SAMN05444380_1241 [Thermophagus xiamenensis]
MNGNSILVDSNVIIALTNGNKDVIPILNDRVIYISVISEMELLSWPKISEYEICILKELFNDIHIIDLSEKIKEKAILIRRTYSLKLPDAIIAATSIVYNIPLFTFDKEFAKIEELDLLLMQFD